MTSEYEATVRKAADAREACVSLATLVSQMREADTGDASVKKSVRRQVEKRERSVLDAVGEACGAAEGACRAAEPSEHARSLCNNASVSRQNAEHLVEAFQALRDDVSALSRVESYANALAASLEQVGLAAHGLRAESAALGGYEIVFTVSERFWDAGDAEFREAQSAGVIARHLELIRSAIQGWVSEREDVSDGLVLLPASRPIRRYPGPLNGSCKGDSRVAFYTVCEDEVLAVRLCEYFSPKTHNDAVNNPMSSTSRYRRLLDGGIDPSDYAVAGWRALRAA